VNILLTGASGFVGRHLIPHLIQAGHSIRVAARTGTSIPNTESIMVGDIGPKTDWQAALDNIDAIIHLAGRAHHADGPGEADAHEAINHQGSRRLAEAAAGRVERLIFLSSLSVHGLNAADTAIRQATPIQPTTPYGTAKARAEAHLAELKAQGRLDTLSLRPPMVYGANAPGNLARLCRAVQRGLPLPLASVKNRRSLIGVDHLAQCLLAALSQPLPDTAALPIADDQPISTPDLVRALAQGLGKPARLLPCPPSLLRGMGRIIGRSAMMDSLTGSLEIDNKQAKTLLGLPESGDTHVKLVQAARETKGEG